MNNDIDKLVEDYAHTRKNLELFTNRLDQLLHDIISNEKIKFQVVESRTKTIESYRDKILRPTKSYKEPLKEITDLVALRIIVYYNDNINQLCEILKKEFKVHEHIAGHDTNLIDIDKFGYLSSHLILSLKGARKTLPEWNSFKEVKFEIQIRTVLQHAWAAISHSLHYKQESDVPQQLRRRLNRVAGLFEIADDEFVSIRTLHEKQDEIEDKKILSGKTDVKLSVNTLDKFVSNWNKKDSFLKSATKSGFKLIPSSESSFLSEIVNLAENAGIDKVSDFEEIVSQDSQKYFSYLFKNNPGVWRASFGFLLLIQFMRGISQELKLDDFPEWDENIINRIISAAKKHKIDLKQ